MKDRTHPPDSDQIAVDRARGLTRAVRTPDELDLIWYVETIGRFQAEIEYLCQRLERRSALTHGIAVRYTAYQLALIGLLVLCSVAVGIGLGLALHT